VAGTFDRCGRPQLLIKIAISVGIKEDRSIQFGSFRIEKLASIIA